jgi:hypothetical protein
MNIKGIGGNSMNSSQMDRVINLAAKDTKKGARVVAKVFYRILLKQGFSENQIIDIATNILSCLIEKLHGHEKKIDNAQIHPNEAQSENPFQPAIVTGTYTKFRNRYHDAESMHYCV